MKFEQVYVLDTNILLDNVENIFTISQGGSNLIVLPETVLDECDSKKTGFETINFQARELGRLLADSEIIDKNVDEFKSIIRVKIKDNIIIDIFSLSKYYTENIDKSILNDRKIIEVAKFAKSYYKIDCTLLSLDIMCRTRAISLDVKTESLDFNKKGIDEIDFHFTVDCENNKYKFSDFEIPNHITSLEVSLPNGKKDYYFKSKNGFDLIDDKNQKRFPAPPLNIFQKVASQIILDKNDITILYGNAGCGKNITAVSAAMRLIDTTEFERIYYIRKTVISGDKEDALGFLPGDLGEKMKGYNYPMEDTLEKIAQIKKKGATEMDLQTMIEEFKGKYNIEYLYTGHLRGSTLKDNSILIIDECQNYNIQNIKTILSRVAKNSIVIILGSNKQIDSIYVNKYTNALTKMILESLNDHEIKIKTVILKNIIRSDIAKWADDVC